MSELDELREERRVLMSRINQISKKVDRLEQEKSRAEHPCSCVRLNREIDVGDMGSAEANRRRTFGLGFVGELLSADLDCSKCAGTGVPREEEAG